MAINNKHANTLRCDEGDDLAECQRERSVLLDDLLPPIHGSVRGMAQWDLIRSQ